jgi:hypothetical protein
VKEPKSQSRRNKTSAVKRYFNHITQAAASLRVETQRACNKRIVSHQKGYSLPARLVLTIVSLLSNSFATAFQDAKQ